MSINRLMDKDVQYICVCVHMCHTKCVFTHTRECYSAKKKNKIVSFVATWVDLEIIVLSEVSQRKINI